MAFTQQVLDHFTDTGLTAIGSHTPNTGSGYTAVVGSARIDVGGTKFNDTGPLSFILNTTVLAQKQACEMTMPSGSSRIGVGVRGDLSGNGYVFVLRDGLSSTIQRWDGGAFGATLVGSGPNGAVGDVGRLEVDGSALSAYINGSLVLTATDATYATGKAWIQADGYGDEFAAYDDAGGAVTHNTRSHPLGIRVGFPRRIAG